MPTAGGSMMDCCWSCLNEAPDFRRYQSGQGQPADMIFKDLSACHHDLPKQNPVST
jgi:hypothetical protein